MCVCVYVTAGAARLCNHSKQDTQHSSNNNISKKKSYMLLPVARVYKAVHTHPAKHKDTSKQAAAASVLITDPLIIKSIDRLY